MEIFKDIEGFEGLYQIGNCGTVRSLPKFIEGANGGVRYHGTIELSHDIGRKGYHRVTLFIDKSRRRFLVHRLVAIAFVSNPKGFQEVNHKLGDKSDNRASELEWCTRSINIKHSYDVLNRKAPEGGKGRINEKHPLSRRIIQVSKEGNELRVWPSVAEVGRALGFHWANVGACARGKINSAYGFKWKYA